MENLTEWKDESYTDSVGGIHCDGIGWNPHGVWCGECNRDTCEGCINEYVLPVDE